MTTLHDAETALADLRRLGGKLRLNGEKVIVDWPGARIPALAERLRAAKPELRAMLAAAPPSAAAAALPGDEPECSMRDRLTMIDAILAQRDDKGRVAYTASQVESCAIGLRRHAGSHPDIDAMLAPLLDAKKTALTWQVLAARIRRRRA